MTGRSSSEREALAKQNAAIMAVFERAGFDHIAPDIIQPADIFLERSGEDIRARTFVFNDPDGNELCLRPDLTVPACRYHLSQATAKEARYCYLGTAFRFPDEALSPQEFTQAGCEWYGGANPVAEEARLLKLATSGLEAAGLTGFKITIGDLGLFAALLEDTDMPPRWRRRLEHQFWRPSAFRTLLGSFVEAQAKTRTSISETVDRVGHIDAVTVVSAVLEERGLPLVTDRTIENIAARLDEKHADRSEKRLPATAAKRIEDYLALQGSATDVAAKLKALGSGAHFTKALDAYNLRIEALEDLGLNPRRFAFNGSFGRELEYYTGLVFQIDVDSSALGRNQPLTVAGGGRYDDLLKDLGAPNTIPAAGFAIHAERLRAVLA
jgi:ATP phosphoribosyltransferase regulatory subunit